MTDDDAELKRLFARGASAPEDDAFVARVEQRIGRLQLLRKLGTMGVVLALAASLTVLTPAVLHTSFLVGSAVEWASREATSFVLSPMGALLGLIVGFAYFTARRS